MLFDIERTATHGQPVLGVVGDLDVTTAPRLTASVDAELALDPVALYVDLTPTTFMDSSGARALARLSRRAADADVPLRVVCPPGNRSVRLVIDLLELRAVVPIIDSLPRPDGGTAAGAEGP